MSTTTLYEDAQIRVEQPLKGVVDGHIIITPQQSVNTIAELDDDVLLRMGVTANLVASVLFETLGVQGTNLVMNEQPVRCDVLARREGDNWKHHWAGVPTQPEALNDIREKISFNIPLDTQQEASEQKQKVSEPKKELVSEEEVDEQKLKEEEEEENYLIRQLYRVP